MMDRDRIRVEVKGKRRETAAIVSIDLGAVDGTALAAFSPGSHIDVHITENMVRQYSLLKSDLDRTHYTIGVLLTQTSRGGSRYIHQAFEPGYRFTISRPKNDFTIVEEGKRALLFAGGIGITPILSMAESLHAAGKHFELHYSTRSRDATAFLDRIAKSEFAKQVHLHCDDDNFSKMNLEQLLSVNSDPHFHLYICGPEGYMQAVFGAATARGWPANRLHRESFGANPHATSDDTDFEVQVASSGAVFQVPVGRSIVSVLRENGIVIPTSCEQGLCGACLTRVVAGVPDHRDFYMNDDEHALNDLVTPCCTRSKSARLILDL
jgi:vanillate monooxygenase ferredoxin subunit